MTLPQAQADAREALTLNWLDQPAAFELASNENYDVDDWAWLFLSLSEEYGEDYDKLLKRSLNRADERLRGVTESIIGNQEPNGIFPDYDGTCRRKYGLAAWIPRSFVTLPRLQSGASWFFPLKAPVLENYNRKIVDESLNLDPALRQFPIRRADKSSLYYLPTNESPFGYQLPPSGYRPIANPIVEGGQGTIWAAIDCSIPVKGQLAVLRDMAAQARNILHKRNAIPTTDNFPEIRLANVEDSPEFEHMRFKFARGCDSSSHVAAVWFAVSVEVLGPLVKQFDELLKILTKKHEELCKSDIARAVPNSFIQSPLPHVKGGHGGCQLKALHMVAELAMRGAATRDIAAILGVGRKAAKGYAYPWHQQFDENLDNYLQTAQRIVNGDYKYLVHEQIKPTDASGVD